MPLAAFRGMRIVAVLFLILFGLFLLRRKGITLSDYFRNPPTRSDWIQMAKIFPALILAAFGLGELSIILLSYVAPEFVLQALQEAALVYRGAGFVVLALVVAPILEEVFFRGMLFPVLGRVWSVTAGVILSSAIFGILHLNVFGAFLFGATAAVFFVKTSSLYIPIALHFFNNLVPVLLIELAPVAPPAAGDVTLTELQQGLWGSVVLAAIGLIFLGRFLFRNWPSRLPAIFEPPRPEELQTQAPPSRAA